MNFPKLILYNYQRYAYAQRILGDLSDVLAACRRKNVEMGLSDRLNYAEQLAAGVGYINSKRVLTTSASILVMMLFGGLDWS